MSEYDCYVDVFRELTGGVDPNGFQFNPMGLLQLAAAADPVIARIMGLYYVDVTARADVLYDYRVIAHYRSGPLCAMVSKVGAVTTQPLESPHPVLATPLTSEVNEETGCASTTRVGVELTWRFQLAEIYEKAGLTPEDSLGDYGIFPISYIVERATFQPGLTPDRHVYQRVTVGGPPVPVPQIFIGTERDPDAGFETCFDGVDNDRDGVADGPFSLLHPGPYDEDCLTFQFIEAPQVWKRGNYFTDFSAAASGKYYYRVRGVDLFGRLSPPAYSGIATVVDNVCPPAPIVTEARIFQTEDREILRLPLDERKHIRAVENHQNVRTVLRVRWQWPEKFRKLQDDLVGFRISMTSRGAPLNPVKDLLLLVDDSDGIPTLLSQADDGSCFDCIDNDGDGARDSDDPECKTSGELSERPPEVVYHYEIYHPIRLEAPVSELNAVETARYYDVRVQAFDRVDNASAVQRPWTVDIRDMTPPDRESKVTIRIPVPKPFEDMIGATPRPRKPSAPDPEGRSSLCLQWDARPNLSYLVYRLDQKRLCEAMIASGIPVYPSCMFLDGTEAYSEAVKRPELFEPVTPGAIGPFAGRLGTLTDFVPGVATNYFYYAVRAVDPAGNESQLSAPSVRITVSDRFAPAKPVIRRVTAVPGVGVTVEWAANAEETPDGDLDEYLLYRTDRLERSKSRNRMMLVQSFPYDHDPSKKVTTHSWTDGSLAAKSGGILYYRLEAIDTPGGNRSKLSEVASVKTVDAIPPTSAITSLNACQIPTTEKGANVTWGFTGTGLAADDQIRVLRRKKASGATPAGRWLALTGWLPIATKSYKDPGVDPAIGYEYGLEVRDVAGNTVGPTASTTAALVACGGAGATSGPGEEESTGSAQVVKFIRGDSNGSGTVDLSDAVLLLAYLYLGSGTIPCLDAADADGSGIVEMGDPYLVLGFLFLGTKSPPDPFPDCGAYAASALGCMTSLDCHR